MSDHVVEGTEPSPLEPVETRRRRIWIAVVLTALTLALLLLALREVFLHTSDPTGGCGGG